MRRFLTLIGGPDPQERKQPDAGAPGSPAHSEGPSGDPPVPLAEEHDIVTEKEGHDGLANEGLEGATDGDAETQPIGIDPEPQNGGEHEDSESCSKPPPGRRLRGVVSVLLLYADDADHLERLRATGTVIDALRDLAEVMVWADQHDPNLWDVFLEYAIMPLLVRCLCATRAQAQDESGEDGEALHKEPGVIEVSMKGDTERVAEGLENALAEVTDDPSTSSRPEDSLLVVHASSGEQSDVHIGAAKNCEVSAKSGSNSTNSSAPPGASAEREACVHTDINEPVGGNDTATMRRDKTAVQDESGTSARRAHKGRSELRAQAGSSSAETFKFLVESDVAEPDKDAPRQEALESAVNVQAQILQTISILIQSVSRKESLLCLFSSNHINEILSFDFAFDQDEMVAYFMSAVKSISLKLDEGLLQLFFDPTRRSFPLYTAVTRFFDHHESMVRIAVRNVTLTIYALGDSEVLKFAAEDETQYFSKVTDLLARLCGSVARALELLLDDGREIRRTRSRTGIFRRRVRTSELTGKLEEIENLCAYLGEVSTVSRSYLYPLVMSLISSRLFSPFFRPLASQASPEALRLLYKRWRLARSTSESGTRPAIPLFDAAARCLVLACVLTHCRSSPLGSILIRDLCRPTSEFEHRHVLHGLKAMATDISGTERVTFISLCAIEAVICCGAATRQVLGTLKYDFYLDDEDDLPADAELGASAALINIGIPDEDDLERRGVEPLLMTLSEFDAPLTPNISHPSTPTLPTMASMGSLGSADGLKTPPNGSTRLESRMSSFDSASGLNLSPRASTPPPAERRDSDGILSSFQLGEISLREAISSVVLVVRRREIRTLRVMYRVVGIMNAVQKRTSDVNSTVDVSKIILDELAGVVRAFIKNKRTTIVSIEKMYDNFRSIAETNGVLREGVASLGDILAPDSVPEIASAFPRGTGKRRRVDSEDTAPPVEVEDAQAFFIVSNVYDDALKTARVLDRFGSLSEQLVDALTDSELDDSYLEKRDALEAVSEFVFKHGEIG